MDQFTRIETAAHEGAFGNNAIRVPTAAQAAANNYKVGRARLHGLDLAIEQPRGSVRTGVSPSGKRWSNRMAAHYGYVTGTRGADGDEIDVFVGPTPESTAVYAINQIDPETGSFDEHKICLGFIDRSSAVQAYQGSYDRDWKGLGSIVAMSMPDFKQWLAAGDKSQPIEPQQGTLMDKVFWDGEQPRGQTFDALLYEVRRHDAGGLIFDRVSINEIEQDADSVETLDALVVPFANFPHQMQLLDAVMCRVNTAVKPVAIQITKAFKQNGLINIASVFELSDGQTLSIFFHTGAADQTRIKPADELVSWKWMLNKRDVTTVVARERGDELDLREVARRVLRLADRNSKAFARANENRAARLSSIDGLKAEVAAKTATLMALQKRLDTKKIEKEIADSQTPPPEPVEVDAPIEGSWVTGFTDAGAHRTDLKQIAREGGYAAILADREKQEANQDMLDHLLDHLLGRRFIDVRNALRERGFEGERGQPLARNGIVVSSSDSQFVGAGRNLVKLVYTIGGAAGCRQIYDDMERTTDDMATTITAAACDLEPKRPVIDSAESVAAEARTDDQATALAASTDESAAERADGAEVASTTAEQAAVASAEGEPKAAIEAIVAEGGEPDALVARLVQEFGLTEADARAQVGLEGVGGLAVTDLSTDRANAVAQTGDDAAARLDSAEPPHVEVPPADGSSTPADNGPESGEERLPSPSPAPSAEAATHEAAPRDPEKPLVNNDVGSNSDVVAASEQKPEPIDGDFKGDAVQPVETQQQIHAEGGDLAAAVDDVPPVADDPGALGAPNESEANTGDEGASQEVTAPAADTATTESAPEAETALAVTPARDRDADCAFLQSIIDGAAEDVFDPDLPARLEEVFSAYAEDPDVSAKATVAIRAYTDLMLARATAEA